MNALDTNIDSAAGFPAALSASLAPFGLVIVATRLLTTLGTRRGIDGALNDRRSRLSLDLWNRLSRVLRERRRQHRSLNGWNIHDYPRLILVILKQFSHMRNKERVNAGPINMMLNKTSQTTLFHGFLEIGRQS